MKNIIQILITINLFLISCKSETSKKEIKPETTMEDSINAKVEANKALVRLWILDGWNNNRNQEVVEQVFAQDWVDGNPTFPDQPKGIAGAMYFVEQYRDALPDIQFNITHLIADTDYVTFRFEANATHQGTLMGMPATNKKVTVTGIVIHKVENGRFVKSWNEVDLLGLKMQLETK